MGPGNLGSRPTWLTVFFGLLSWMVAVKMHLKIRSLCFLLLLQYGASLLLQVIVVLNLQAVFIPYLGPPYLDLIHGQIYVVPRPLWFVHQHLAPSVGIDTKSYVDFFIFFHIHLESAKTQ
ncbi:hypothetical protein DVH24_039210 [Malus domestica]|uniref:Uncharacterized protein n=1 Tax=Malus domestica TaxID=3750 RepID=A0A498KC53_MALDO|nr:hypothetical protein DVH24_039210 [Malus domestica]